MCPATRADTLEWALQQAYQNNPSLNAQRAQVRVTDENVPQALSGYRPVLSANGNAGGNYSSSQSPAGATGTGITSGLSSGDYVSRGFGLTATQALFNGMQTASKVRQAESQVLAARETLRVMEQQVLLDSATAYMDVLRYQATVTLYRSYVVALTQFLKIIRDNYITGALPSTDVAQAESRLAGGRSLLLAATSNYVSAVATYRRVIGVDPGLLAPGSSVDRLAPATLDQAVVQGEQQNPSVLASMYGADAAELNVKLSEAVLYPSALVQANAARSYDPGFGTDKVTQAAIIGQLAIPVYQGGTEYSAVRQSKETLGQQRLTIDVNRDQARQTVVQSWAQTTASKAQIGTAHAEIDAAELALDGVRDEARTGQRTTIDVLNAQQELLNARISLVNAQRDRVVNSYTLLAAVGGLSARTLGLKLTPYDPQVHYFQIRDAWTGLRNADGR